MLVAHRALGPLLAEAGGLRRRGRASWPTPTATTPMVGRTLLQQALPVVVRAASGRLADGNRQRPSAAGGRPPDRAGRADGRPGGGPAAGHRRPRGRRPRPGRAGGAVARRSGSGRRRWPPRWAYWPASWARSPATPPCSPSRRWGRPPRAATRAAAGRARWPTSETRWPRCRCWPAPSACPVWWRRRWRPWSRSTSARRAPGRPSGGSTPSCSGWSGRRRAGRCELLEHLQIDPERMAENLERLARGRGARGRRARRAPGRGRCPDRPGAGRAPPTAGGGAGADVSDPVELHYEIDGAADGPALVLGGSLGTTLAMWEPQRRRLGAGARLIRFDHRGHGGSPVPDGPYEIADLGRDVLALLDRLGLERASFCGLSIGGMVGQWLAINAPERIERLILICTAAHVPGGAAFRERAAIVRAAGGPEVVADAVVGRWFTPAFAAAEPELVASLPGDDRRHADRGLRELLPRRSALTTSAPALGRIRAPTLVISGAQDASLPPALGREIADGVPGARFELLDPAAHLASVERADAVNDLIAEHLSLRGGTMSDPDLRRRHEGSPRGARRRARRPRDRAHHRVHRSRFRTSSPATHGAACGRARAWTAARPQRDHAGGADRTGPRERDRDARARRAAQRTDPGGDRRGPTAYRHLRRGARRQRRLRRSPSGC